MWRSSMVRHRGRLSRIVAPLCTIDLRHVRNGLVFALGLKYCADDTSRNTFGEV
jgi:hypothetical protein